MFENRLIYHSTSVVVGSIPLGGDYPIRIQTMTNTDTLDTKSSVAQCIRIAEAGADYVRLTAQGVKEAKNLANIKRELRKAGFDIPLIADIHFNPAAAEAAAAIVEKVRINPGNYADKRNIIKAGLSDKEYNDELERIHRRLLPLINICHNNGTAIRIGVNHGSLSGRILDRYGNTPEGMAMSAMEFIRIFRVENFNKLVISMKSSDLKIMIEATRMLIRYMTEEGMAYPLHLGVTEAGEGEDGIVRSAAGIGALLAEGIGDTIRVSLTGDPEKEIPVAKKIAGLYPRGSITQVKPFFKCTGEHPVPFKKIQAPLVVAVTKNNQLLDNETLKDAGYDVDDSSGLVSRTDLSADLIIASHCPEIIPESVFLAVPHNIWLQNKERKNIFPVFSPEGWSDAVEKSNILNVIVVYPHSDISFLKNVGFSKILLIFSWDAAKDIFAPYKLFRSLENSNLNFNIVLNPEFEESDIEELQIKSAAILGGYLADRQVSGISISNKGNIAFRDINSLCFSILQCTGSRITRTVYISCPTCGRTKFSLHEAVRKVKEKTSHFKGLKIAVMGCIVNGPGEMADADWGYVGAGPGKVHIYKKQEPVLKNVPEDEAVDKLLKLIEEDQASR